ncbi:MAG: D-alanyl-D-alanine carboxypeptidase/D-alanyl-D-alanine-endopeptidase [Gammaproteobacteria bacterium]|jgi:D-alanyl-D-alanine carboxypeptidase/D-alanyl-D-alanine-endopeptidase (penicillin-binding protein 4)|nr:D-alanyl-D-alanine carboxypeptidase/D-alanyl-D-alanine-endopeptidase [Gammaproteobacteria bacterium]MDH3749500.1 D-alanyl-D-alanine carboxypeptidase/D-alanyl-D-alanine-endopeptidase [Gammaproteobacteria bacterium]MDH3804651.1 D-alanyl-D-alanine carboxypeptidase/D-alanyl-D-alanine-endopeptidase [Gammaproteobacteria bacterium]
MNSPIVMQRLLLILALAVIASPHAAASEDDLPLPVQSALNHRQIPHDTLSIYVEDLENGEVIVRWQDGVPRNPGSTIKLLTTLVALDVLGPAYTWQTDVFALGPVDDGRLDGDLLIKGYGDPFLVTERVWQLLRRIRQAGIREIGGDLLLDDSYFAVAEHDPAAFDRRPLRAYNIAPNALLTNFKVVRYWFEPNYDAGNVRVWLDPPLPNLNVDNRLTLVPGSCRGYQRGIAISANDTNDTVTFSGKFPSGCKRYAMDRSALGHNEFTYGLFTSLWRESGGVFEGGWKTALAPEDVEPVIEFRSMPLADVIARVNKHSNNVMARQLLYTVSAETLGVPGTEAGGRKVVAAWLQRNGLEFSELAFDNGAGLSRAARMTAEDFGSMLRFAWQQPYMPEYVASMSLPGLDGTLTYRLDDGPLVGNAHLKTGSLDHVSAIAGYLQTASGRRLAVVVLQNHTDIHRGPGEEIQEALLRWLYEQ